MVKIERKKKTKTLNPGIFKMTGLDYRRMVPGLDLKGRKEKDFRKRFIVL